MPGASSRSSGIDLLTDLANASFWFGFISAHERGGTGWFEGFRLHTELVPVFLFFTFFVLLGNGEGQGGGISPCRFISVNVINNLAVLPIKF